MTAQAQVRDAQSRQALAAGEARRYVDQTAIIVVTHDEKIIPTSGRLHNIRDGRTYEEAGEGRALN